MLPVRATIVAMLALTALPADAFAGRAKAPGVRQSASAPPIGAPIKECTRFNGRYGYYGNPWCNAAEQDRWDRWEAARVQAR